MSELVVTRAVRVAALVRMKPERSAGLFSFRERSRAARKPRSAEGLAARLAAKLGFLSLLRASGFPGAVSLSKIEVLNQKNGKPRLLVGDRGSRAFLNVHGAEILVSLAHTRVWGVATLLVRYR